MMEATGRNTAVMTGFIAIFIWNCGQSHATFKPDSGVALARGCSARHLLVAVTAFGHEGLPRIPLMLTTGLLCDPPRISSPNPPRANTNAVHAKARRISGLRSTCL